MQRYWITLVLVLMFVSVGYSQQYLTSIPLPVTAGATLSSPGYMAVAPARNKLYVVTAEFPFTSMDDLVVIDTTGHSIVTSLPFSKPLGQPMYNPVNDRVYLASFQLGIQIIDPSTDTVVGTISSVPETSHLAVNTATHTIYASDWRASRIHVIDGNTNTKTGEIPLPPDSIFPGQMVVNPNTNRIYMTYNSGSVFPFVIIDGNTNTVVSRDFAFQFAGLEMDPVNNKVFVRRLGSNLVAVFDMSTETFLTYGAPLGGSGSAGGSAYNPTTNRIHFSRISNTTAPLDTMDPVNHTVVSTLEIPNGESILEVEVNPLSNKIFVAQRDTFIGNETVGMIHVLLDATLVEIDIKPGAFPNSVNLGSNGTVPVAVLSTATFDATTVDPLSVTLASAPVRLKGKGTAMYSSQDVNEDGRPDLVVHIETSALQLSTSDSTALLEGQTYSGASIQGSDSVRVVPE